MVSRFQCRADTCLLIQPRLQLRCLIAAAHHLQVFKVADTYADLSTEIGFQASHTVYSDNELTVDAEELIGIELLLYLIKRHIERVLRAVFETQFRVLVFRVDVAHLLDIDDLEPVLVGYQETLAIGSTPIDGDWQGGHAAWRH